MEVRLMIELRNPTETVPTMMGLCPHNNTRQPTIHEEHVETCENDDRENAPQVRYQMLDRVAIDSRKRERSGILMMLLVKLRVKWRLVHEPMGVVEIELVPYKTHAEAQKLFRLGWEWKIKTKAHSPFPTSPHGMCRGAEHP